MILGHRRGHLAMFCGLAVIVPAALVVSVLERDALPPASPLPEVLAPPAIDPGTAAGLAWTRTGPLWDDLAIAVAYVPNPGGAPLIAFHPTRELRAPKVLVYWAPGPGPSADVPVGAILLGALAGTGITVFPLPPEMRDIEGRFLVYSLGHQRVLGAGPTRPAAPRAEGTP